MPTIPGAASSQTGTTPRTAGATASAPSRRWGATEATATTTVVRVRPRLLLARRKSRPARGIGSESRLGRDGANGACQPLCRRRRPTTSLAPTDRSGKGLACKACSCVVGGSGNGTVERKRVGGALVGSGADRRASAAPSGARREVEE